MYLLHYCHSKEEEGDMFSVYCENNSDKTETPTVNTAHSKAIVPKSAKSRSGSSKSRTKSGKSGRTPSGQGRKRSSVAIQGPMRNEAVDEISADAEPAKPFTGRQPRKWIKPIISCNSSFKPVVVQPLDPLMDLVFTREASKSTSDELEDNDNKLAVDRSESRRVSLSPNLPESGKNSLFSEKTFMNEAKYGQREASTRRKGKAENFIQLGANDLTKRRKSSTSKNVLDTVQNPRRKSSVRGPEVVVESNERDRGYALLIEGNMVLVDIDDDLLDQIEEERHLHFDKCQNVCFVCCANVLWKVCYTVS